MHPESQHFLTSPRTHAVRVDSSGRIGLPAELREQCHIETGQQLILEVDQGQLRVKTYDQLIDELQEFCADVAPPDVVLSDKLIQQRLSEAAWESADLAEPAGSHE